jgi:hypothetical protein
MTQAGGPTGLNHSRLDAFLGPHYEAVLCVDFGD